jgi:hypothetical protein
MDNTSWLDLAKNICAENTKIRFVENELWFRHLRSETK